MMKAGFDFDDLFIFDMANNHQGSLDHGLRIIREIAAVVRENRVRGALKFQFRQLDTFVHPAHLQGSTNKHIPRFLSTRLSKEQFGTLVDEVREQGLITECTPFDEDSVDLIVDMGIEVVKVASSSATDWPLLERISECDKPVIFSTGGLALKQIDDVVSFFDHRRVHWAVMHCVSLYPTPDAALQLNQIEALRRRYPGRAVGFSTHEKPEDLVPVQVAVAKGARLLERHVGVETSEIKLNAYSSTPEQIDRWIKAAMQARSICGETERPPSTSEELSSLQSLYRGIYMRRPFKRGVAIERSDVYFAMPCLDGQLNSGEWRDGMVAVQPLEKDQPLVRSAVQLPPGPEKQLLFDAIHTMKAMLNEAHVALSTDFEAEFSHHCGISEFPRIGCTFITCVDRSYCKKLVIQTPGQHHPTHYHKRKEETFQVLYGILEMEIDGRRRTLYPGDTQLIQQGVWHEFWSDTGVIFEEISTAQVDNDSYYEDKAVNRMDRSARKTIVNHWGRYQI